jgi:hypothetical protein
VTDLPYSEVLSLAEEIVSQPEGAEVFSRAEITDALEMLIEQAKSMAALLVKHEWCDQSSWRGVCPECDVDRETFDPNSGGRAGTITANRHTALCRWGQFVREAKPGYFKDERTSEYVREDGAKRIAFADWKDNGRVIQTLRGEPFVCSKCASEFDTAAASMAHMRECEGG